MAGHCSASALALAPYKSIFSSHLPFLQQETNTKIAIRGRGSVKEGANKDPKCEVGVTSGAAMSLQEQGVWHVRQLHSLCPLITPGPVLHSNVPSCIHSSASSIITVGPRLHSPSPEKQPMGQARFTAPFPLPSFSFQVRPWRG